MFKASSPIADFDPELSVAMEAGRRRQEEHMEWIASENYTSPCVPEAQGPVLTNQYAEGCPGKRYYGGSEAWRRAVEQNEALRYNVIYFDYNSSAVSDEVRRVLSHHTGFLRDNPAVTLRIEGHADERGSAGYTGQACSRNRRAELIYQ